MSMCSEPFKDKGNKWGFKAQLHVRSWLWDIWYIYNNFVIRYSEFKISNQCGKDEKLGNISKASDNALLHCLGPSGRNGYRISEKAAIVHHLQQKDFCKIEKKKGNWWINVIGAHENWERCLMHEWKVPHVKCDNPALKNKRAMSDLIPSYLAQVTSCLL